MPRHIGIADYEDKAESKLSPAEEASRQMFERIEEAEHVATMLIERLRPVLNPKAMEAARDDALAPATEGSVSEYVATIQLQALRIELVNERLRQAVSALEV